MILHALALILASAPASETTLSVKVVSLDFNYPYYGEPGNTCQRGNVYMRAVTTANDGHQTPVVVRLVDSAGMTPGTEAVLDDVRRAGTGRDGTAVYCAAGRLAPAPLQPAAPVETPPPLPGPTEPVATADVPSTQPAAQSAAQSRCTVRLFNIIKKSLGDKKVGPSEFDPESALDVSEAVDCSVARSRVTNVLLVRMVKDGFSKPAAVVGAEWGGTWQRDADAQRRVVKVYLVESPDDATAQR